jgi:uncharacterized protein (UPF0147 family)
MEKKDLMDMLDRNPARLLELADEGERARSIELLWVLALDEKEPKPVRKTAKKALYMLKSRGADVERLRPAEAAAKPGKAGSEAVSASCLSLPDSSMNTLLLIVVSGEGAVSSTLYQAVAHPERGITKLSSQKTSGKQLAKYLEQNPEVFPVPAEYALFRFRGALQKSDRGSVSGLDSLPGPMRGEGAGEVPHPVLALLGSRVSRILHPDEERKLFGMNEVARLILVGDEVPRYRERMQEAKKSRLIVGNRSPEERTADVIDGFVSAHFTPARRETYGTLLFDLAFYYARAGMREEARVLVDYGRGLRAAGPSLKDHPVVRFLVYKEFLLE